MLLSSGVVPVYNSYYGVLEPCVEHVVLAVCRPVDMFPRAYPHAYREFVAPEASLVFKGGFGIFRVEPVRPFYCAVVLQHPLRLFIIEVVTCGALHHVAVEIYSGVILFVCVTRDMVIHGTPVFSKFKLLLEG